MAPSFTCSSDEDISNIQTRVIVTITANCHQLFWFTSRPSCITLVYFTPVLYYPRLLHPRPVLPSFTSPPSCITLVYFTPSCTTLVYFTPSCITLAYFTPVLYYHRLLHPRPVSPSFTSPPSCITLVYFTPVLYYHRLLHPRPVLPSFTSPPSCITLVVPINKHKRIIACCQCILCVNRTIVNPPSEE